MENHIIDGRRNIRVGRAGEQIAADHLIAQGHRIIDRNWRCRVGEIDIVATDGTSIVFAEVKCRTTTTAGHPFEAITSAKRARLRRLAAVWLADHPRSERDVRLDVLAVLLASDGSSSVEHLRGLL